MNEEDKKMWSIMIFMLIFEQLLSQTSNNELIPFASNLNLFQSNQYF